MTNETLRAAEVYAWDRLLSGGIWKRRSVDDLREARAAVTAAIEARVRAESAAASSAPEVGWYSDSDLLRLYGEWSEDHYASSFMPPDDSSIQDFLEWLTPERAAEILSPKPQADYEIEMLRKVHAALDRLDAQESEA